VFALTEPDHGSDIARGLATTEINALVVARAATGLSAFTK
jgi:hypothetical protein